MALRVPYWDWAANSVPPPEIIEKTTVEIQLPSGELKLVPNPFLAYKFNPAPPATFLPQYKIWPTTLRYPNSAAATATSNVNALQV